MLNQNMQPIPMLAELLDAITSDIAKQIAKANYHSHKMLGTTTLCQQILEANDNSGCLNLAITFNAPDTNDACDFTSQDAFATARHLLYNHALMLSDGYNLGETVTQHLLNSYHLYNHIDGLIYFNATITITDCTLYINCIYNQQ